MLKTASEPLNKTFRAFEPMREFSLLGLGVLVHLRQMTHSKFSNFKTFRDPGHPRQITLSNFRNFKIVGVPGSMLGVARVETKVFLRPRSSEGYPTGGKAKSPHGEVAFWT